MTSRFTKLSAAGEKLPADATEWVAVLDNTTGLIWSVAESKRLTWKKAAVWAAGLTLAGASDWRLPTVEELFLLADRTKYSPAIDTEYFPHCKSDWYWTSTPAAFSPAVYAWCVYFGYGDSNWAPQGGVCFVRAVRPSQ